MDLTQQTAPQFIVIAGPNGAGKSTSATALLPDWTQYINADEIAKSLPRDFGNKDFEASRQLLLKWDKLKEARADFAVETTLASKSLSSRIKELKQDGYSFHLIFFWLPSVEIAIERVAERVRAGGHDIPVETIRRRYRSGIRNFFQLYQHLSDSWVVYRNLVPGMPEPVAEGSGAQTSRIFLIDIWEQFNESTRI